MADNTEDLDLSESNIDKLAGAISKGIAATAPKKVSLGQYLRRKPTVKLNYTCYQNGFRIPEKKITPEQASYLNRITRPGRYINRLVEVALWEDGGAVNIDFRYTNNTPDARFELKNHFRSFLELVQMIVEEQDVILAKAKRTQSAVDKILAQNEAEEGIDDVEDEPRIESVAVTPKQEALAKKSARPRTSFASAATRKARAEAGI